MSKEDMELLKDHKKAFMMSGKLSKFHEDNMILFPKAIFEPKSMEVEFDFENKDSVALPVKPGFIKYHIVLDDFEENKLELYSRKLSEMLKAIFFEETEVYFIFYKENKNNEWKRFKY